MESFWKEKRVLVTGANGFAGAWIAKRLLELGAIVTALVRDRVNGGLRLHGLVEQVACVRGDITDGFLLGRILGEYEIDTVLHLAAQALVPVAACSPLSSFESNVRGTWTVLEQCRLSKGVERIVVSTSDKVYGDQDSDRLREDAALRGLAPYDASKVCADVTARAYARSFDLPIAVVRFANIYGGGDLNFSRIIPYSVRNVLLGEPVVLRSDGSHLREYLYVEDAVSAFLTLASNLDRPEVRGEAFNFGSDHVVRTLALVEEIIELAGRDDHPIEIGRPVQGEISKLRLDSSKARRLLGWQARVPLSSGLRNTIDWYRRHLGR